MKKRQSPYSDVNTVQYTNNSQRIHGINTSAGRADSFPADHDQYYAHHRSSSVSHPYNEATGNLHRKQLPDPTSDIQNATSEVDRPRPRPESQEQDMEIGYEDNPVAAPLNYQGLEKKFQDETLNLLKEQVVAQDAEITRHKEKIFEISNQYQEKLSDLRAQQAKQREEFLRKEFEALIQSYQQQQSVKNHVPGKLGLIDDHGYVPDSTITGHLARKVGPIDNHGYIDDNHGYIPEGTTAGHLARKVDHNDNHGYIPEPNTTGHLARKVDHNDNHGYIPEATGHLARKVQAINGRVYSESNGAEYYHQAYSAVQYHNQEPDRAAIHSADKTRTSGRVPMPYGRVYNNSRAGV